MFLDKLRIAGNNNKLVYCLLFVIGIELLSSAIQNEPTIKGIQVGHKEIKITQYADDTTVLVRNLDSVPQLLKLLNNFKNISGLEINKHKTEAMRLGSWRNCNEKPFGFKLRIAGNNNKRVYCLLEILALSFFTLTHPHF